MSAASRRALELTGVLALLTASTDASAAIDCAEGRTWARACVARSAVDLTEVRCTDGHLVLGVRTRTSRELSIDVTLGETSVFRRVGDTGLSPVGDFPDWKTEPVDVRDAFDAVVGCARARPPPTARRGFANPLPPVPPGPGSSAAGPRGSVLSTLPVATFLSAVLALVLCAGFAPRRPFGMRGSATKWVAFALFFMSPFVVWALRSMIFPTGYLHQNGQGPEWVAHALARRAVPYGPGYADLYHWVTRLWSGDPDRAIFNAQAAVASLGPLCAWLIARASSVRVGLATVIACGVAAAPVVARAAQSESYFGVISTLLFAAAAVLAVGARASTRVSRPFLASVLIAGLMVSVASRVHPVGWIPAATLAGIPLALAGRHRGRLVQALVAGVGVGGVVALTAGSELIAVVQGPLGRWTNGPEGIASRLGVGGATLGCLAVVLSCAPVARPIRAAGLLLSSAMCFWITRVTTGHTPWIDALTASLYAPIGIAALGALVAAAPRAASRRAPWVLAVGLGGAFFVQDRAVRHDPTDVVEAHWALEWRNRLPAGSRVIYLEEVGNVKSVLPLRLRRDAAWRVTTLSSATAAPASHGYYYRLSLCSTPEGAAVCDEFESHHQLELVEGRVLPSVPSVPWARYVADPIRVGLYRVGAP